MAETLVNGTTIPQGSDPIHSSGVQAMRNLGGSVDGQLGNRYTKAQADALLAGKASTVHTHSWAQVTGKPTVFPPAVHGHQIGDVDGLQAALDEAGGEAAWDDVTGKPATFPPSTHSHAQSDVEGLNAALNTAAESAAWASVTGKPESFPPTPHEHPVSQVTGLQAQLDALTYDSGERNITASVNPDENMTAGNIYLRRVGKMVQLNLDALVFTMSSATTPIVRLGQPLIPVGFRPVRTIYLPYARRDLNETHGDVRIDSNGYVYLYQVARASAGATSSAYYRSSCTFFTNNNVPTTPPGDPA